MKLMGKSTQKAMFCGSIVIIHVKQSRPNTAWQDFSLLLLGAYLNYRFDEIYNLAIALSMLSFSLKTNPKRDIYKIPTSKLSDEKNVKWHGWPEGGVGSVLRIVNKYEWNFTANYFLLLCQWIQHTYSSLF